MSNEDLSADSQLQPSGESELGWLRRRLDDQEQLLRRHAQQTKELGDGVVSLVRAQTRRHAWTNLNSFVAYLLFTVLLGFGAYVLFHSRMAGLVAERDRLSKELGTARGRVAELQDQQAARQAVQEAALAFYGLVKENKRAEIVAKYGGLPQASLTLTEQALFGAAYRESQSAIIDSGLSSAVAAYRSGNVAGAISDLTRLLETNPDAAHTAQIRYYLGVSRIKSGQPGEAISELASAIDAGAERAGLVDVVFQYATALEEAGQLSDAKLQYEAFVAAHPAHALSWPARRKIRALEHGLVATGSAARPKAAAQALGTPSGASPKPEAAASKPWLSPLRPAKQN